MNLDRVGAGKDVPNDINVIIEIPMHADPIKYELDKDTGAMFVDRFLSTAMRYPVNYGFIPHTLGGDGDPLDALVLTPFPLITGSVIRCRPIGALKMTDESGDDAKLIVVPVDKLLTLYHSVKTPDDVSPALRAQLAHFFEHYKDLEPNKWVKVQGWVGPEEAKKEILEGVKLYNAKK